MAKTKKNRKSAVDVIKKVSKKETSQNPFEVHVNKSKFKVLGQKSKNDVGLPGVSRSKAIQKRKVTLLQEYKFQDKTNKFFDHRIGEHNKNMTKEDKIMARFTAEKMKAHTKTSLFNLDDDVVLTHGGRTLEEIEQFEDPCSDDEDDSDGRNMKGTLDSEFVKEAHFGGGMLTVAAQDGELRRKDLISQLIADSKKRKAEKQQLKESTTKLTEQLDSEWKDLLPLLNPTKQTTQAKATGEMKGEDRKDVRAADGFSPAPGPPKAAVDKSSFDYLVKELRFEATGKPSDKLKSEDEIVRQEKEKLERLERERLNRMTLHATDHTRQRLSGRAYKSADDLDDGFALEDVNTEEDGNESEARDNSESDESNKDDSEGEENEKDDEKESEGNNADEQIEEITSAKGVKRNLDESGASQNDDIEESESEEEDENSETDEDSFDDLVENDESDENSEEEMEDISEKNKKSKVNRGKASKDVMKKEESDLKDIKVEKVLRKDIKDDKQTSKDKKSIRFIVDNKEAEENMKKVEDTEDITDKKGILRNVRNENEEEMRAIESKESKELKAELATVHLPFTFEVPKEYEALVDLFDGKTTKDMRVILERMIKVNHWSLGGDNKANLNQLFAFLLQYLDDSVDSREPKKCWQVLNAISPVLFELCLMDPDTSGGYLRRVIQEKYEAYSQRDTRYPGVDSLLFLKLVSTLFPTSDARHYVTTPALIFLCHALGKSCPVSTSDVAVGVFLATLCVEYIDLSKRYLPELVNYLQGCLLLFSNSAPLPLTKPFKSVCQQLLAFRPSELTELRSSREADVPEEVVKSDVKSSPIKKMTSDGYCKVLKIGCPPPSSGAKKVDSSLASFTITAVDLCSSKKDVPIALKVKALVSVLKLVSLLMDKYALYDAAYLIFENIVSALQRLSEELKVDVREDSNSDVIMENGKNDEETPGKNVKKRKWKQITEKCPTFAEEGSKGNATRSVASTTFNVILDLILNRIELVLEKFATLKGDHPFNYVTKEKEKPKILRLFEPEIRPVLKFHTKGAQKEREKLLSKYKKEMKGAVREIRKDGRFLQKVKLKRQSRADEERQMKVKRILGNCANEEGEIRNLKRKKK